MKSELTTEIEAYLAFNREKIETPYIELFQQFELIKKHFQLDNIEESFNIEHSRLWHFCLSLMLSNAKETATISVDELFYTYYNAKIFSDNYNPLLKPSFLLCMLVNHYYSQNENAPSTQAQFKQVIERFTEPYYINLQTRNNLLKIKNGLSTKFDYIKASAILDGISYQNLKPILIRAYSDIDNTIYYRSHHPIPMIRIGEKTWELFDLMKEDYKINIIITNSALMYVSKINMPLEISNNLTYLNLSYNQFTKFPEFINDLKKLTDFVFIKNPLNNQSNIWYHCNSLKYIKILPLQFKYLPLGLKRFGILEQEYHHDLVESRKNLGYIFCVFFLYKFFTSNNFNLIYFLGQFIIAFSIAYCVQKQDIASKQGEFEALRLLLQDLDRQSFLQNRQSLANGYQCTLANDYIPLFNTFKKLRHGTDYFTGKAFKRHVKEVEDAQLAELFEQTLNIR